MQLVILGYHRSGTSAVTQHLMKAGLFVGDDLIGSNQSNPYGHFEDRLFFDVHERILRENGERWLAPNPFTPIVSQGARSQSNALVAARDAAYDHWGFKDPRACLFIDHWRTVLPDPRFLVCLRHYRACIHSLLRRALNSVGNTADKGLATMHMRLAADPDTVARSWIAHMLPVMRLIERCPERVHVVSVGRLTGDASIAIELTERFGLPLAPVALAETFQDGLFSADDAVDVQLSSDTEVLAERV
ncbi:MAG: hypothetical protein AAGD34_20600, partial [Pseudomonadota bacterium]